jgi:cytochrome c
MYRVTLADPPMRAPLSLLIAAAVLHASSALASPELARDKVCMGCHAVDRKLIGPSFKDVAARYAGQPDAVARMSERIVKGGSGAWGAVPMPASPRLTPDEARQLATWVLGQK